MFVGFTYSVLLKRDAWHIFRFSTQHMHAVYTHTHTHTQKLKKQHVISFRDYLSYCFLHDDALHLALLLYVPVWVTLFEAIEFKVLLCVLWCCSIPAWPRTGCRCLCYRHWCSVLLWIGPLQWSWCHRQICVSPWPTEFMIKLIVWLIWWYMLKVFKSPVWLTCC